MITCLLEAVLLLQSWELHPNLDSCNMETWAPGSCSQLRWAGPSRLFWLLQNLTGRRRQETAATGTKFGWKRTSLLLHQVLWWKERRGSYKREMNHKEGEDSIKGTEVWSCCCHCTKPITRHISMRWWFTTLTTCCWGSAEGIATSLGCSCGQQRLKHNQELALTTSSQRCEVQTWSTGTILLCKLQALLVNVHDI